MLVARILLCGLVLLASACFDPAASRCQIACASGDVCPGALVCDVAAARCVTAVGECSGAGSDGPDVGDDGALGDGAVGGDALPPFEPPTDCVGATLCGEVTDFNALPPGWIDHTGGGCEAIVAADALELDVPPGVCALGTSCSVDTPTREIGTGRVTARLSGLSGPSGVLTLFAIERDPASFVAFELDGDDRVAPLSVVDGVWGYAGERVGATLGWYGLRITTGGLALFERWDGAAWVELGRAATALRPTDGGIVRLSIGCPSEVDLGYESETFFGAVGGGPP